MKNRGGDISSDYRSCQINVNVEGELLNNGNVLIHKKILREIFASVMLINNHYILKLDNKFCEVEVEDTFFVVRSVRVEKDVLKICLNDGLWESLDPEDLWQGKNQIIYCLVKNRKFPARFIRKGYYQLANFIFMKNENFFFKIGKNEYPLIEKN